MRHLYLFLIAVFLLISSCSLDPAEKEDLDEMLITLSDSTWKALSLDLVKVNIYDTYNDYQNDVNGKQLEGQKGMGYTFSSRKDEFWLRVKAYNTYSRLYYENKVAHYSVYTEPSIKQVVFSPRLIQKEVSVKLKSITINSVCSRGYYSSGWDDGYLDDHLTAPAPDVFLNINTKDYFIFPEGIDYEGNKLIFSTPVDLHDNLVLTFYDYDFNISEDEKLGSITIDLSTFLRSKKNILSTSFCGYTAGQVLIEFEL